VTDSWEVEVMKQAGAATKSDLAVAPAATAGNRWWIYQRERFPLVAHTPIIAAFSLAAAGYSALARGSGNILSGRQILVAFAISFSFFLQLRLADEFKDFEEDSLYRPYRPVPRGLITLREVAFVWASAITLQLLMVLWLSVLLLPLLAGVWAYLLLMSREFFVRRWLKRHEVVYMISHMIIMPLIFLLASACDWIPAGWKRPSQGIVWMMLVNFFVGMVIEIGRKVRSPDDEERGVETYSHLWGLGNAVFAWLAVMTASAVVVYPAARGIRFTQIELVLLPVISVSIVAAVVFLKKSDRGRGRWIEAISGVWALVMYLGMGIVPLALRYYGGRK
jgi:4-hydroxybenzoate polyprenyltransferase